jgi:predicted methyltransferase
MPRSATVLDAAILAALTLTTACGPGTAAPSKVPAPPPATDISAPAPEGTAAKLTWAIRGEHRSEDARARDANRHPSETLTFFGLRDDMTVLELWPGGGGWYTEILAPVLRDRGKLIVTNFDPAKVDGYARRSSESLDAKLAKAPNLYGRVLVQRVAPPAQVSLGPDDTADMVLTFRNFHNWMQDGYDKAIVGAVFKVLKPGGTFGIVEHRAKPGTDVGASRESGYVPEQYVVDVVTAAGFKLVERSEVNANPKDTKDHPGGVWALPPVLTHGEKDRARYLAIGESDRMTLKFSKP